MKKLSFLTLLICVVWTVNAQTNYKKPPADVARIIEAPQTPSVSISPAKDAMLLTELNPYPGIATLAQPYLKLAGLRINPALNARQRITEFIGFSVQWLDNGKTVKIQIPGGVRPSGSAQWAPDGSKIAFPVDVADGVELWVADTKTGAAKRLDGIRINDLFGAGFFWMDDSKRLTIMAIPAGRGKMPEASLVPSGPTVEESSGKQSQVMTYQDLLRNESDERQFEYLATSQILLTDAGSGKSQPLGAAGMHTGVRWSPDHNYMIVNTLRRPFSFRVPWSLFARKTEVWDKNGTNLRTIVEFPVTDEIPRQGVVTGPRSIQWQALHPARLLWVEALDGGDPKRKVEFRDKLMLLDAPFKGEARELLRNKHRNSGFEWTKDKDLALMTEYDRDRRWSTTYRINLASPAVKDTLFDLSINDDYNNPGDAIYERLPNGEYVIAQDGDWAWFRNDGASEKGNFPRLDQINLRTGEKKTVFRSAENAYEYFVSFVGKDRSQYIIRSESKTMPPNFYLANVQSRNRKALTSFIDPAPELTGVEKRIVKYTRPDGVPLSGTLMLPPGYKPGTRLPLFIWAYPLEYSDKSTAGQVRGSDNTFTFYRGSAPELFVTQGYAVLMDATIPIVGDPETMNNTFIEQAVSSGKAAIDYLDSLGIVDPKRVGVGGHSYGAFMTANLLAHSNDYAFGIARSGAYNRTLTPFGFQSERRSFWEARDIYMNVSPFTHAEKIKKPLLLIHGEADNNPGTFTVQSERLFQAIKGNGGTARLVLLPYESHGYRAIESIEHTVAEMFEWANKYGKQP